MKFWKFHGKKDFQFDKQEGLTYCQFGSRVYIEGIFCKSLYQIHKPIEICNFVLWYHEDNNSVNVYYDLAYPNKTAIKRIRSLNVKQVHFLSWKIGKTQNMEFLRKPLENMEEIHLTWSFQQRKDFCILNCRFVT